jgi:hypothetical protein
MTSMRKHSSQRQYLGAAITSACPSDVPSGTVNWHEQERIGSSGSPP